MSTDEFEALLVREGPRVEWKREINDPRTKRNARKTIAALANDVTGTGVNGHLIVGVDDAGAPVGLAKVGALCEMLDNFIHDGSIQPLPDAAIDVVEIRGVACVVAKVRPQATPPVRLGGDVFVRTGPQTVRATPDQERILAERGRAANLPFDARPVLAARFEDLDIDRFRNEYLPRAVSDTVRRENSRSIEHQLLSHRLLTADGTRTPTAVGLLLLSPDPAFHIGGAGIDFVRFDGKRETDGIRDRARLNEPLLDLPRTVAQKLSAHIETALTVRGEAHENLPSYPLRALRELVHNAIIHRTYEATNAPVRIRWFSNRVEIESPGGPYGIVNADNFGSGVTDYRNRHIAEVMYRLGFVEKLEIGLQIARHALEHNGNRLQLAPGLDRVTVTAWARP